MNTDYFSIITDQQIMDMAINYNAMLFRIIAPYLHGNVLEIGSGIGNFTKKIIDLENVVSVTCFEINQECCNDFKKRIISRENGSKVKLHEYDFNESSLTQQFDFIFSFNVLEHIKNDKKTLNLIERYLRPGAKTVLYLPAMNCIYGSIDKELGHHRRYDKKMIKELFRDTSLNIEKMKYLNTLGALGWLYTNRVLKRKSQSSGMVFFYDKYIFPPMNYLEQFLPTFFGANLLIKAKK